MDRSSQYNPSWEEALEACRPGSDDLASEPELQALAAAVAAQADLEERFERLQRLDTQLAAAFQEVPVPADLADRLLADCSAAAQAAPRPTLGKQAFRHGPRRLWAALGTLATAAAVLWAVWLGASGRPALSKEALVQEAHRQFAAAVGDRSSQTLLESPAPEAYPLSSELRRGLSTRWRWIGDFLGYSGVAYDLVGPDQTKATLYVLRGDALALPTLPSSEPEQSAATGQCSVTAWQTEGLVYVLIVDGGPHRYQQFLDLPRGPVT